MSNVVLNKAISAYLGTIRETNLRVTSSAPSVSSGLCTHTQLRPLAVAIVRHRYMYFNVIHEQVRLLSLPIHSAALLTLHAIPAIHLPIFHATCLVYNPY